MATLALHPSPVDTRYRSNTSPIPLETMVVRTDTRFSRGRGVKPSRLPTVSCHCIAGRFAKDAPNQPSQVSPIAFSFGLPRET